jgi:hypothetical protein
MLLEDLRAFMSLFFITETVLCEVRAEAKKTLEDLKVTLDHDL